MLLVWAAIYGMPVTDFESMCFLISPIGEEGSPERTRAGGVKRAIVEPAAQKHDLTVVRADEVSEPGTITTQIVEHLVAAKVVVADLTESNPNVFYELAVRDAAGLSAVLIMERGTTLPFDKAQDRAIPFDCTDLSNVMEAADLLAKFLGAALEGNVANPIAAAMVWKTYSESDSPVEQLVGRLGEQMSEISAQINALSRHQAEVDTTLNAVRLSRYKPFEDPSPQGFGPNLGRWVPADQNFQAWLDSMEDADPETRLFVEREAKRAWRHQRELDIEANRKKDRERERQHELKREEQREAERERARIEQEKEAQERREQAERNRD